MIDIEFVLKANIDFLLLNQIQYEYILKLRFTLNLPSKPILDLILTPHSISISIKIEIDIEIALNANIEVDIDSYFNLS